MCVIEQDTLTLIKPKKYWLKSDDWGLNTTKQTKNRAGTYFRAEETTFDSKERDQFNNFCAAYAHSLLPYLNKCLQTLFPPAQIAQVLGMSISDVFKLVGIDNFSPVVQNFVSLTLLLSPQFVNYISTSKANTLLFFVALQRILTFLQQKITVYL